MKIKKTEMIFLSVLGIFFFIMCCLHVYIRADVRGWPHVECF